MGNEGLFGIIGGCVLRVRGVDDDEIVFKE